MYFEIRETDIDRHVQSDDAVGLLAIWRERAVSGRLPALQAVLNADLPARQHVLVATPVGRDDWRYCVVGTSLRDQEGDHWQADAVSGLQDPDRTFVRRCFALTTARREPVYAIHSAPNSLNVLLWERLMLPCLDEEGRVAIVTFLRPLEYFEDMIRAVLDSTPTAILRARCIRDQDGIIVDAVCLIANGLASTFLRRPMEELNQGLILEVFPTFWDTGVFATFVRVVETREPCHFEMQYRHGQHISWFNVSAVALADGFTLSLADITGSKLVQLQLERARNDLLAANAHLERQAAELEAAIAAGNAARADLESEVDCRKILEEELRRLALTDALTGLANRPAVAAQGQALALSGRRRGYPLCAITIDVDHFKAVNDTYGHAAGDKVLAALAAMMQEIVPPGDGFCGRLGGEEFVVVLPRTGLAAALDAAERLRAMFAAGRTEAGGAVITATASFGVAEFREGEEFEDMLARSDEALYCAKRDGRNRVVPASPDTETRAAA